MNYKAYNNVPNFWTPVYRLRPKGKVWKVMAMTKYSIITLA